METDRRSEFVTWTSQNKQDGKPESSTEIKQTPARGFPLRNDQHMHVRKLPKVGERITPKDKKCQAQGQ